MLFITLSNLWTLSIFAPFTYTIFIISILFYCLPTLTNKTVSIHTKTKSLFVKINSTDVLPLIFSPIIIFFITLYLWNLPSTSAWFGHIIFTSYQLKASFLLSLSFFSVLGSLLMSSYLTSREIYDYIIVLFNFFYWIILLFNSNSILTSIFIIEVISAVIFLLIVTSTFSSVYFYRNLNFTFGNLFQNSTPYTFLQSLIYYFWISLISALNLFLFILLLYLKIHSLDWFTIEHIFNYLVLTTSYKNLSSVGLVWFVLLLSIFIKSGIAPLYLYKPTFFKGLPFYTLFFYICFFYFAFFLFVINLLNSYFSEIFYFYSVIMTALVVLGLVTLLFIICESYYLKIFLAISSILNSLFVFLALTSLHSQTITLWI